jgi:TrmH family RNA methyltransferase
VTKVIVDDKGNNNTGLEKIVEYCKKENVDIGINRILVTKLAKSENAYCVGVFNKYRCSLEKSQNHVVLINPSDMGNLGTIIRTMLAFDVTNLAIIKPACDIFDPKVIRASMGALFKLNFEYFETFGDYESRFNNNLYTFRIDANDLIGTGKFDRPFSLIFGNEGAGLTSAFNSIGKGIKIPQSKNVDSLNLAVAVGIALNHTYSQKD